MSATNLERSAALRRDAAEMLRATGIDALLQQHGQVAYLGSYALDLMAWPDVDVNVVLPGGQSIRRFMELCTSIAQIPTVTRVHFQNFLGERPQGFAPGLYGGVRLRRELHWKMDLWSLDRSEAEAKQREVERIRGQLDGESRAAIVDAKFALLTPEGRTPIGSGHRIYEAVLSKGLRDLEEIRQYLRDEGVEGV